MMSRTPKTLSLVVLPLALVGCADESSETIGVDEVIEDENYYYACGNETLDLTDGRTFYPLHRDDQDTVDEASYAPSQALSLDPLTQVAPPQPGDDTGTLTIYEDGMARWASESGIEAWLTDEPQEYDWIC